jgi:hypothetical protein
MGLISLVACQILAPFVWMSANSYEEQCRRMGVQPDGLGFAAKLMGIIGTVLLLMGCFGGLAVWAFGGTLDDIVQRFRS